MKLPIFVGLAGVGITSLASATAIPEPCAEGTAYCISRTDSMVCKDGRWVKEHCESSFCNPDGGKCSDNPHLAVEDDLTHCIEGDAYCADYNKSMVCKDGHWVIEHCDAGGLCYADDGKCTDQTHQGRDGVSGSVEARSTLVSCDKPGSYSCGYFDGNSKSAVVVCKPNHQWQVQNVCGSPTCCQKGPALDTAFCTCSASATEDTAELSDPVTDLVIPGSSLSVRSETGALETASQYCETPGAFNCGMSNGLSVIITCTNTHQWIISSICGNSPDCCDLGTTPGTAFCNGCKPSGSISASEEVAAPKALSTRQEEVGPEHPCKKAGDMQCYYENDKKKSAIFQCTNLLKWVLVANCGGHTCCVNGPNPGTAYCKCAPRNNPFDPAIDEGSHEDIGMELSQWLAAPAVPEAKRDPISTSETSDIVPAVQEDSDDLSKRQNSIDNCPFIGAYICGHFLRESLDFDAIYYCLERFGALTGRAWVKTGACGHKCCYSTENLKNAWCDCNQQAKDLFELPQSLPTEAPTAPAPTADLTPNSEDSAVVSAAPVIKRSTDTVSQLQVACPRAQAMICGHGLPDSAGAVDSAIYVCGPELQWRMSSVCNPKEGIYSCCKHTPDLANAYCECSPEPAQMNGGPTLLPTTTWVGHNPRTTFVTRVPEISAWAV